MTHGGATKEFVIVVGEWNGKAYIISIYLDKTVQDFH